MTDPAHDQLAAALGHQLKTPIAVLSNVAPNLRRSLEVFVRDVASLVGEMSADAAHRAALGALASALAEQAEITTGLPNEGRIDQVVWQLGGLGIDGDLGLASSRLIRSGMDRHIDALSPLLTIDPQRALSLLDGVARIRSGLTSIESSSLRMRGLSATLEVLSGGPADGTADAHGSLRRIVAQLEPALPDTVQIRFEGESPVPVCGREDVLGEIWSNLLSNAIAAVGSKGTILIQTEVRRESEGAIVVVRITDDGPGIRAADLEKIFEPGFTTRSRSGGRGLGLALARRMLSAIGGTVAVTSEPGATCFAVTMRAPVETALGAATGGPGERI